MPIALDPTQTFDFVLASDREKPDPPSFQFRYLTRRQLRRVDDALQRALETRENAEVEKSLDDAILTALAGWKNMGVPFSADALDDVLTLPEKWEMALQYPIVGMNVEAKKKPYGSDSSSATGNSGATVAEAAPPNDSPSTSTASTANSATVKDATIATGGA